MISFVVEEPSTPPEVDLLQAPTLAAARRATVRSSNARHNPELNETSLVQTNPISSKTGVLVGSEAASALAVIS